MTAIDLLRYRLLALSRRVRSAGSPTRALVLCLGLSAVVATGMTFHGLGVNDTAELEGAALARQVRDRTFWLVVLEALVFAYTTFEVIFRARDTRFVARLPLPGASRWLELLGRAKLVHLPLLLPFAAYALGLWQQGHASLALQALGTGALTWGVGIPLCAWLHLLAGRTLLGEATAARHALAGGVVPDEAALLLYSPSAGLACTLVLGILVDELLASGLGLAGAAPRPELAWGALAAAVAAGGWLAWRGAQEADRVLAFVVPRFAEVDASPHYTEDGIPERTAGEGLARLLPAGARPFFLRDLRQLRRRHRLDRILLWLWAAWCARLAFRDLPDELHAAVASDTLVALALFVGLILVSAFRIRGAELAAPALDATLPRDRRAAALGELAASIIHPAWALLWAAVAAGLAAGPGSGLLTLTAGLVLIIALVGAARGTAQLAGPPRAPAAAFLFRAALLSAVALVSWNLP